MPQMTKVAVGKNPAIKYSHGVKKTSPDPDRAGANQNAIQTADSPKRTKEATTLDFRFMRLHSTSGSIAGEPRCRS